MKILYLTFFIFIQISISAVSTEFERIQTVEISGSAESPRGDSGAWGTVAVFPVPGFKSNDRAVAIDNFPDGDILLLAQSGSIFRLSGIDPSKKIWQNKLPSNHIQKLAASPNGKTFAVSYTSKARNDFLEIRDAKNGAILYSTSRHARLDCGYTAEHTMQAWSFSYSFDGTKIAAFFHNQRSRPNADCLPIESDTILVQDTSTGKILSEKTKFIWDFWLEAKEDKDLLLCSSYMPISFLSDNKHFVMGNCNSKIAKYSAQTLKPVAVENFFEGIRKIVVGDLGREMLRERFPIDEIQGLDDGSFLAIYGGQGDGILFRIPANLGKISLVTVNQGAVYTHISYSPNKKMFMANSTHINLWDLKTKKSIFYGYGTDSYLKVRFHNKKKAIVQGDDNFIRIIAELPSVKKNLEAGLADSSQYIISQNMYCVKGPTGSKFQLAYKDGKDEWVDKRETFTEVYCAHPLGPRPPRYEAEAFRPFNLLLQTDVAGEYTFMGVTGNSSKPSETLNALPNW